MKCVHIKANRGLTMFKDVFRFFLVNDTPSFYLFYGK